MLETTHINNEIYYSKYNKKHGMSDVIAETIVDKVDRKKNHRH